MVEGVVDAVTAAGMTFTVPGWDGGRHLFGPAPWPVSRVEPTDHGHRVSHTMGGGDAATMRHDHVETVPARGARCLVLFLGAGVEKPWVLGWWPA